MRTNALLVIAAAAVLGGCATAPDIARGRKGSLVLPDFEPRPGGHCESSAMLNALAYLGYGITEADIAGGGGAPGFLFTNQGFPFVGGRNERMREIFLETAKVPFGIVVPEGKDDDWSGVIALLERGVPVLLRVDMRYLPYLYGGKYGPAYMSFGWHVVCLYGVDFDAGEALVTDTEKSGPCRVALRDLDRARGSSTKVFPPRREYAWVEPRPSGWAFDPDALLGGALKAVLANYDSGGGWRESAAGGAGPLVGLAGLAAFPTALKSIHTTINPYALASAYSYMANSIERNGTGGSAFRAFFRDFLAARAADCTDPARRAEAAALVGPAGTAAVAWNGLASAFYESAAAIGSAKRPAKAAAIGAAEAATADRARSLYDAERALRDAIASALSRLD